MKADENLCSQSGCTKNWNVSCMHGQWCWPHGAQHRKADTSCDLLIIESLILWHTRIARPFIKLADDFAAALTVAPLHVEQVEQEIFPVKLKNLEALKDVVALARESAEAAKNFMRVLEEKSNMFKQDFALETLEIRKAFEGAAMPDGLDDIDVWVWYARHIENQISEQ